MLTWLIVALSILPVCVKPTAQYASGYFTLYNKAPTDGTIDYHQNVSGKLPQDLSEYEGVIAYVTDCSKVGQDAWIRLTDHQIPIEYWNHWLPVKVFDCGGHQESIDNFFVPNNIIGELGFYLADKTGAFPLGRGIAGDLSWEDPTMDCATPTPILSPTMSPPSTPTIRYVTVPPLPSATFAVPTAIVLAAVVTRAPIKSFKDILYAPMFTEKQILVMVCGVTLNLAIGFYLLHWMSYNLYTVRKWVGKIIKSLFRRKAP